MRRLAGFLLLLLAARGAWSLPPVAGAHLQKNRPKAVVSKNVQKVLFPGRLDRSTASNPGFRLLHREQAQREPSLQPVPVSLEAWTQLPGAPTQHAGGRYGLPHRFVLESQYGNVERTGPRNFQDPVETGRILKTTSLGLAYPLTSRLTLSGRYAIIKGTSLESLSSSLGATYRVNAATSISLSYRDLPASETVLQDLKKGHHTSAELKIHF